MGVNKFETTDAREDRMNCKETIDLRNAFAIIVLCVIAFAAGMAEAPPQSQKGQAPTPQQMMGYFAGEWKLSGTAKTSPTSQAAPYSATEHAEWVPGGYFLEIHSVSHGPMGDIHGVRMLEYDPSKGVYTYNAYNSLGEHQIAVCRVQGDTWVWNADEKMNGVAAKGRYTMSLTSPTTYTFKSEVQKPGGGWYTVIEGTATRQPAQ